MRKKTSTFSEQDMFDGNRTTVYDQHSGKPVYVINNEPGNYTITAATKEPGKGKPTQNEDQLTIFK